MKYGMEAYTVGLLTHAILSLIGDWGWILEPQSSKAGSFFSHKRGDSMTH